MIVPDALEPWARLRVPPRPASCWMDAPLTVTATSFCTLPGGTA